MAKAKTVKESADVIESALKNGTEAVKDGFDKAVKGYDQLISFGKDNAEAVKDAQVFVDKVTFAQGWHGGNPKFLACFRDLTNAMPEDGQSYVTSVRFDDELQAQVQGQAPAPTRAASGAGAGAGGAQRGAPVKKTRVIRVTLSGKTSSDRDVDIIRERLGKQPRFKSVTTSSDAREARSGREVSFTANFIYVPED